MGGKRTETQGTNGAKGEGEYCPGEWCQFCRAAVKCRARAAEKLRIAEEEFKLPPLLTDEEIESILPMLPDITKWANEISAYALEAALNHGKQWSGFKVVEGRSNRKFSDEDAVAAAAQGTRVHGYLPSESYHADRNAEIDGQKAVRGNPGRPRN